MFKKIGILVLILLIPFSVAAAEFTMGSSTSTIDACASETAVIVVTTTNTGSFSDTYTLTLSGESFAMAAPSGFVIGPGESKNSYIYVTVPSDTLSGTYELVASVSSNSGGQQSQSYALNVGDCHSVNIVPISSVSQDICTCTSGNFGVEVHNTGKWTENFRLSLSGNGADFSTLSESLISLQSGESRTVAISSGPTCGDTGEYDITVTAKSLNSNALDSTTLDLSVNGCYDFDFALVENYLSFCDNSEAKVPINLQNKGTTNNGYRLSVEGPSWASFEQKRVVANAGKVETSNLVLSPVFGVAGNFPMTITVEAEQGDIVKSDTFTANVLSCRQTSLDLSQNYDFICGGSSKSYQLALLNAGKFTENYAVSVDGPGWSKLSKNFVSLGADESINLNLELVPTATVPAGKYTFTVTAESQNVGRSSDSDSIEVSVPARSNCFGVQIESESQHVEITHGQGELVPVIINNIGSSAASYELEISGDGANLAQVNPGVVELEGNSAETVYLHFSAPDEVVLGNYKVIISARNSEDKAISGSEDISLEVVESKALITSDVTSEVITEGNETATPGLISKSLQSLSSALSSVTSGAVSFTKSTTSSAKGLFMDYWHLILIVFGTIAFLFVIWRYGIFKRSEDDWLEELEELFREEEKEEEPKPAKPAKPAATEEKSPGLWRRFVDWLTEEDEFDDFEFEYEEPKKKVEKKVKEEKQSLLSRFATWLEEDDEPTKPTAKPAKKTPKKPVKKKSPSLWQRLTEWMFEEVDEPTKKTPKKPIAKKKTTKKDKNSAWQKFKDWLEEDEE